jgi:hypothetical protein
MIAGASLLLTASISALLYNASIAVHQVVTTTDVRKLDIADLIRACDQIVEAEVVSVRDLDLSVDSSNKTPSKLLDVRVRNVLWGESGSGVMKLVAGPDTLIFHDFRGPRPGDVDIWFIERWHELGGYDARLRERLKEAAGTSDVMQVVANGRGRFPSREESGRRVVWVPTYAIALWEPVGGGHEDPDHHLEGWICADRGEFLARLLDSVMRLVPSIDVELQPATRPWISINPGGRCRNFAIENGGYSDIGTSGLAQILDVARNELFFDLPVDLGRAGGPEHRVFSIRIRTEHGSRLVRIHSRGVKGRDDPSAIDAIHRAHRVLHAMPYAKDWQLEDH